MEPFQQPNPDDVPDGGEQSVADDMNLFGLMAMPYFQQQLWNISMGMFPNVPYNPLEFGPAIDFTQYPQQPMEHRPQNRPQNQPPNKPRNQSTNIYSYGSNNQIPKSQDLGGRSRRIVVPEDKLALNARAEELKSRLLKQRRQRDLPPYTSEHHTSKTAPTTMDDNVKEGACAGSGCPTDAATQSSSTLSSHEFFKPSACSGHARMPSSQIDELLEQAHLLYLKKTLEQAGTSVKHSAALTDNSGLHKGDKLAWDGETLPDYEEESSTLEEGEITQKDATVNTRAAPQTTSGNSVSVTKNQRLTLQTTSDAKPADSPMQLEKANVTLTKPPKFPKDPPKEPRAYMQSKILSIRPTPTQPSSQNMQVARRDETSSALSSASKPMLSLENSRSGLSMVDKYANALSASGSHIKEAAYYLHDNRVLHETSVPEGVEHKFAALLLDKLVDKINNAPHHIIDDDIDKYLRKDKEISDWLSILGWDKPMERKRLLNIRRMTLQLQINISRTKKELACEVGRELALQNRGKGKTGVVDGRVRSSSESVNMLPLGARRHSSIEDSRSSREVGRRVLKDPGSPKGRRWAGVNERTSHMGRSDDYDFTYKPELEASMRGRWSGRISRSRERSRSPRYARDFCDRSYSPRRGGDGRDRRYRGDFGPFTDMNDLRRDPDISPGRGGRRGRSKSRRFHR